MLKGLRFILIKATPTIPFQVIERSDDHWWLIAHAVEMGLLWAKVIDLIDGKEWWIICDGELVEVARLNLEDYMKDA